MNSFGHVSLAIIGMALVGCQTRLSGDYYDPPMAKHPLRLQLSNDGTYSFQRMYAEDARLERGRWWRVQEDVVMLVPDDATKPQWFARVAKKSVLKTVRYSIDVRDVLTPPAP
jgi:hypothetical protein